VIRWNLLLTHEIQQPDAGLCNLLSPCGLIVKHQTMSALQKRLRRKLLGSHRRLREWRMIFRGLTDTDHPVLAHIIPMRRCNLACAYCNEYDDVSSPVPLQTMFQRVDRLASLGTTIITISGGEPLLHPQLDDIISRVRKHGALAGLITNGYLLTA